MLHTPIRFPCLGHMVNTWFPPEQFHRFVSAAIAFAVLLLLLLLLLSLLSLLLPDD